MSPRPLLRPASSRNPGELGAEADRERDRKILRQHRGYDGHGPRPPDRGDRFVVEIGDAGAGRNRCDKDVTIAVDQELHHHDARAALTGFRLNALTITLDMGQQATAIVRSEEHTSELQSLMRNSYA